ncbi:MAG: hypothetical protein AB7T49_10095 [Oligoflexales bacterium]
MRRKLAAILILMSYPAWAQDEPEAPAPETPQVESEAPQAESEPSAPAEQPTPPDAEASSSTGKGLLGDFRVGPTVSLAFPHLGNASVEMMYKDSFSAGVSFGRFKRDMEDTAVEIRNWDVRARWHPFSGSFFLGAAYGNQGIVGSVKTDLETKYQGIDVKVPTTIRLAVDVNYLTPHFGWFAVWDSGFTMGFELGYQMPLKSDSELQVGFEDVTEEAETELKKSDEYKKEKKDIEDLAQTFGEKAIPYVNLIRIGYLF